MILLGIDFETQGLEASKHWVTEAGVVLWDSEVKQPVRISGFLCKATGGVSAEITKITGITNAMLDSHGVESRPGLQAILAMSRQAQFLVAHNAPFDRGFLEAWCKREGLEMPAQRWVDTRVDLPIEAYQLGKSRSLKYLACDTNIMYTAHRAVSDVLAMLEILGKYDIAKTIERALTPNTMVRAVVDFDHRLLARERGYFWKPETKQWLLQLKENEVELEQEKAPFPVVVVTSNTI